MSKFIDEASRIRRTTLLVVCVTYGPHDLHCQRQQIVSQNVTSSGDGSVHAWSTPVAVFLPVQSLRPCSDSNTSRR
jgi:hypothetical protein